MDPYDEEILNALKDGKPMNFHQILDTVAFSHNTLRLHLNSLVDRSLIVREKTPSRRRGRPVYLYRASAEALPSASRASERVVALRFGELRRLCRDHRGGRCRKSKDRCEPDLCPQIRRDD